MAQASFPQGEKNPPIYVHNEEQERQNQAFIVVDQQPPTRSERFPYSLPIKWIFAFSIAECVIASIMIIFGIVNLSMLILHFTTEIAFPIWCGSIILANGIIGCILKWKQSKCLVGAYLGLSITSLVLTIVMLVFYSIALHYFDNVRYYYCSGYPYKSCRWIVPHLIRDEGLGFTVAVIVLAICEFACSIASVALSGKAYSKCFNTCNADDCCTCLGCCECDATQLNYHQVEASEAGAFGNPTMQMASLPHTSSSYNPNQFVTGWQTNPCSGIITYVINLPASFFDTGNENAPQPVSFNVTAQPVSAIIQDSASNAQKV